LHTSLCLRTAASISSFVRRAVCAAGKSAQASSTTTASDKRILGVSVVGRREGLSDGYFSGSSLSPLCALRNDLHGPRYALKVGEAGMYHVWSVLSGKVVRLRSVREPARSHSSPRYGFVIVERFVTVGASSLWKLMPPALFRRALYDYSRDSPDPRPPHGEGVLLLPHTHSLSIVSGLAPAEGRERERERDPYSQPEVLTEPAWLAGVVRTGHPPTWLIPRSRCSCR
jgi:hypothetical protein